MEINSNINNYSGDVARSKVPHTSNNNQSLGDMGRVARVATAGMNKEPHHSVENKAISLEKESDLKRIESIINQANNKIKQTRTRFEFSYHEATNRVSIKIFDKETDEIIKEIPPEESLDMLEKLWEIAGLFVDESR